MLKNLYRAYSKIISPAKSARKQFNIHANLYAYHEKQPHKYGL